MESINSSPVSCSDGADFTDCHRPLSIRECQDRFEKEAVRGEFDNGRYRCRYYVWGQGPVLAFIPGLNDDSHSFLLPIARLSEKFCCLAYDMPTGADDGAHLPSIGHADLVDDFFAVLDHLQIDRVVVFGSSFGSTVALQALRKDYRRFSRAILQGGFARRPLAPAEVLLASFGRYWPWPIEKLPFREATLAHQHGWSFRSRSPEIWRHFLDHTGRTPMKAVAHRALLLHRTDLRPRLADVLHPVLLIAGERDPLVGKECERELQAGLKNAARAEIEGCGHLPQYTHPEVLAEVVGRYLVG